MVGRVENGSDMWLKFWSKLYCNIGRDLEVENYDVGWWVEFFEIYVRVYLNCEFRFRYLEYSKIIW